MKIIKNNTYCIYYDDNGFLHREDGPAVEYSNGYKEYRFEGIQYENVKSDELWLKIIKRWKWNKLLSPHSVYFFKILNETKAMQNGNI